MDNEPHPPPCYEQLTALCEVVHSLHGRVVELEERVTMLERAKTVPLPEGEKQ